jgi:hypothetical protein
VNGGQSAPGGRTVRRLTSADIRVAANSVGFQSVNGEQSAPVWRTVHRLVSPTSRGAIGSGQRSRDQRRTIRVPVADYLQFSSLNLTASFCERQTIRALNSGQSAGVTETHNG